MLPLVERLKNNQILICDGAMGTSLHAAGLLAGDLPESWNISNPGAVKKIHESFIAAGSDMITTNTFGANASQELIRRGVEIAKDAVAGRIYVLGDIGPTGKILKPIGDYSEEDFYAVFFKKAKILAVGGVDAFIIETMSALDELKISVSACKAAAKLPVIVTMAFAAGDKGYRTMMGVSVEQAVNAMLDMKCDVTGANCGCGSKQIVEIMSDMRKYSGKDAFLIAQPNAGMPKLINGETVFTETPDEFAGSVAKLKGLGVNIIGGCCGTTPEHIKEIASALRASQ